MQANLLQFSSDWCYRFLYLRRLQSVQHAEAYLLSGAAGYDHVIPTPDIFRLLPVRKGVIYMTAVYCCPIRVFDWYRSPTSTAGFKGASRQERKEMGR